MNRIGNICRVTGIVIGILGTIGSFIVAKDNLYGSWNFKIFLYCEISIFILGLLFIAIAEILEQVTISAYNIKKLSERYENNYNSKKGDEELEKSGWSCPSCGKRNYSYTGTCSCGQSKYDL